MAGRPPLLIGTFGKIRTEDLSTDGERKFRAYCKYRGVDGVTRRYSATGTSAPKAERALKARLAGLAGLGSGGITPESRFSVAAREWMEEIRAAVEAGDRSPTTQRAYKGILDRHVIPALGELRLRECTTGRIDAVLRAIGGNAGNPTAKSSRTIISGVLGYAARRDAVTSNATRDTRAISTKPKKVVRALTPEECGRWLQMLSEDEQAVSRDLVDLTMFMLAVGCRIGEAIAVQWEDVDLDRGLVQINWTVARVKGQPLFRKKVKSDAGVRRVHLPDFALELLRRRAREQYVVATGVLPIQGNGDKELDLTGVDVDVAVKHLAESPVFPDSKGGYRDPSNTSRALREARGGAEFSWVTSHVFRKTAATIMDDGGHTARQIANVLGHARPSMTQDVYLARAVSDPRAASTLHGALAKYISGQ